MLLGSNRMDTIKLWHVRRGEYGCKGMQGHFAIVDGAYVLCAHKKGLTVWGRTSGQVVHTLMRDFGRVRALVVHPQRPREFAVGDAGGAVHVYALSL
jgi:hypothetical protein